MEIFTIGFTKKTACQFFETLNQAGVRRLIDIRLNNTSQLAGFAKRDDLEYFLRALCKADYRHEPLLAPTAEILADYQKKRLSWEAYAVAFTGLLAERTAERLIERAELILPTVLLCSEPTAARCHRRLVAEYLAERWGDLKIVHL